MAGWAKQDDNQMPGPHKYKLDPQILCSNIRAKNTLRSMPKQLRA